MASDISLKGQYLWVSNQRLSTLLAFALQVGSELACSDAQRGWVEKLRQFEEQVWPGISFDLDELFPGVEEKSFWARAYHEVGRRIFLRQLGNYEETSWQSSAIGDAYVTARMLTWAVQEVENGRDSPTEHNQEDVPPQGDRINIQM